MLGAAAGGLLFVWLSRALRTISLPPLGSMQLSGRRCDGRLLRAGARFRHGALCGIVPAWRATRSNVVADIQSGESYGATGRLWMRHAFVVGQVAASVTLLVISALLIRSLMRIAVLHPGFDLDRGLVAAVNLEADRYAVDGGLPSANASWMRSAGCRGLSHRASRESALGTETSESHCRLKVAPREQWGRYVPQQRRVPHFATLGIRVVAGREFDARDREGSPQVAIVSEAFARAHFPESGAWQAHQALRA